MNTNGGPDTFPKQDAAGELVAAETAAAVRAFEREKWEAERHARDREIEIKAREAAVKEREADIKAREAAVKESEAARSLWQTAIGAAIIAAVIAAAANAVVAAINGFYQRDVEDRKSEATLIAQMLNTNGDRTKAKENVRFIVDAHLISEPQREENLKHFVKITDVENFPSLSTLPPAPPTRSSGFIVMRCSEAPALDPHTLQQGIERVAASKNFNASFRPVPRGLNVSLSARNPSGESVMVTVDGLGERNMDVVLGGPFGSSPEGKEFRAAWIKVAKEVFQQVGVAVKKCEVE